MTEFLIIGGDTGLSVGYCALWGTERIAYGQAPPDDAIAAITRLMREHAQKPDTWVTLALERYNISKRTARMTQQPQALEVIGALRNQAHVLGVAVVLQEIAPAKILAPNALLRKLGWYLKGSDVGAPDADDANDATRQALLWLARHRATAFDRLTKPT
jgi:hypothetical protein